MEFEVCDFVFLKVKFAKVQLDLVKEASWATDIYKTIWNHDKKIAKIGKLILSDDRSGIPNNFHLSMPKKKWITDINQRIPHIEIEMQRYLTWATQKNFKI